jgi:tRNA A-37 threonylcarbamoyl transferase component Bud32
MDPVTSEIRLTSEWREIAAAVDRYENAVGEELPDVAEFLDGVSAANRVSALVELLQVEQEHRWRRRKGKTVEEYLDAYPELREHPGAIGQLARSECRLRCGAGDRDFRKDFSRRFPELELECDTLGDAATVTVPSRASQCKACPTVRPRHIGRYLVETRIGSGTYGVVYRCHDPDLDRLVAIKVTRDACSGDAGLLHEAQNVASLSHPNIVGLLDYGRLDDGRPYIVYEHIAGRTLAERIAARDYTLGEAIRWTVELTAALQAAHRRRIYHRDLKPANVLVDGEGTVRLTDFGLARRDDAFYLDDRGAQLGTLSYMSPEQAAYRSDWAGPAADIYSLGVVLYELLCGRVPFHDVDRESLVAQILQRPPVPPRSLDERIPARVEQACLRALEKDPAKRFRTAGDFGRALQAAVNPTARRRWLAVAAAAAVAGLGMLASGRLGQQAAAPAAMEGFQVFALKGGDAPLEVSPKRLPAPGEKLKFSAQLSRGKAFWCAIVFASGRAPQVFSSATQPDGAAAPTSFFETPKDRYVTVPPGKGVMAVILGARSTPFTGNEPRDFAARTAASLAAIQPPAGRLTALPQMHRPTSAAAVRGGENPEPFDFPEGLRGKLEELFPETYCAEIFPWCDAPPRGANSRFATPAKPASSFLPP